MSENNITKLAVIGAGPGGYAAAFLAADLGMEVALIDPEPNPGGVCLFRGCIPSKALLHVSKVLSESKIAENWGIEFPAPKINLEKLRDWKANVVKKLTGGLGQLSKRRKITYIQGRASFMNSNSLEISPYEGEKYTLKFEYAIIATGSRPSTIPSLNIDSPRVMNSTTALDIQDVPDTLLIIGGGYIGLEMGTVYSELGSTVTVVEMLPNILPGADDDLVKILAQSVNKKFASILTDTKVVEMRATKNKIKVNLEGKSIGKDQHEFDKVLISVGRKPNSENIGLEKTDVKIYKNGFIEVDNQLRTKEHAIFAIGDVVGEPMLAHKASHQGRVAVEVITGRKAAFEPHAIPAVVFTDPEVAWCGITELQAKEQNREVEVVRFPWAASGRALTMDRTDGMTKLIIDPETERILGMGVVGTGAGELISEGVLAIEMATLATDIKLTIHPHPTLSETIMEAAELLFGQSTHIYRPKRK